MVCPECTYEWNPEELAAEAFGLAAAKLPVPTTVVKRTVM